MLRIRLSRGGKKKQPHYRVVVANVQSKRDGRVVERIGHYNPLTNPPSYKIDESRALYWISVGAQPSEAVKRLLVKQGTYARLERLRAGESMEVLVAEYEGVPTSVVAEAKVVADAEASAVAEVIEEAEEAAVVEAIEEAEEAVVAEASAVAEVAEEIEEPAVTEAEAATDVEANADTVVEDEEAEEAAEEDEVSTEDDDGEPAGEDETETA